MRHYIYRNRSWTTPTGGGGYEILGTQRDEIIFECDAGDILEADKMLLAVKGIVAGKQIDIGCTFEDLSLDAEIKH